MQITIHTPTHRKITAQICSVRATVEERDGGWEDVCGACLCVWFVSVCEGGDLFALLFEFKYL